MRTSLTFLLLVASAHSAAQIESSAGVLDKKQEAVQTQLAKRLAEKIAVTNADADVAKNVKQVRDRIVLDQIEHEFEDMLKGRPLKPGTAFPIEELERFEKITVARTELYDIAKSNIPDDKIQQVSGYTKADLLKEARKNVPNLVSAELLTAAFPKWDRGSIQILNPLTPDDRDVVSPSVSGTDSFNPTTGRMVATYPRKRFRMVGVLADISKKPYRHLCSGTLISGNWFLTATHCLFDEDKKTRIPDNSLGVFFPFAGGSDTVRRSSDFKESKNLKLRTITKSTWFGELSGTSFPRSVREIDLMIKAGNDATLVELVPSADGDESLKGILVPVHTPSVKPPLTLAGFGLTNAKNAVGDLLLEVGLRTDLVATDDKGLLLKTPIESSPHSNGLICKGDSGGPVFLGNVATQSATDFQIIAIASSIIASDGTGTVDTCAQAVQRFTRLDRGELRKWICDKASVAGCKSAPN